MSDPNPPTAAPSPAAGGPTMSTPETLTGIFFEPERTFESLRERPRFLVAALILIALGLLITVLVMRKVNFREYITDQVRTGPNSERMSEEQKQQAVAFWTGPAGTVFVYAVPLLGGAIGLAAGGSLYLLASLAMGGRMSYKQALSVWVYSSFAPGVISALLAVLLLFIKSADQIDLEKPGAGLAVTNLGALVGSGSPALRAALSWFDIFTFYGMFLAAIGLRKVGKLSSASAWTIVIVFWAVALILGIARALAFGR